MKLTKSILVAALVVGGLFAGSTALFAQNGGAGGAAGGRRVMNSDTMITRFQTALGETNKLTEAEIPKVKTVLDDMIKKQADLRTDTSVAQEDKQTKRTAITKEASDKLKAIVTPAQFKIIQPLLRGGGRRGGGTAPAPAPGT
jgi:hypothetical protein